MKIALGQLQLNWENKEKNIKRAESYLSCLADQKVDLFCLPEMSLTGFSMHTERTKEDHKETVARIRELAVMYDIAVGVGWVKDAGARCENHYSIVTPDGEILDYAKIHPFSYGGEDAYFQGGASLPVCTFAGFCMGVQICYDLRFPEPFQLLSRQADLIFVPANWPAKRRTHWKCLLKARAIENMSYIFGINCAGEMGGQYYAGDSMGYAPDGNELPFEEFCLPDAVPEEKVLILQVERGAEVYREQFPIKDDRRDALYLKLQEELLK